MPVITMQDGAQLHYRDAGSGRPVIFLHGWAATGAFFDKQLPLAKKGLRLIIPDLRGHGLSQHPNRNLTISLLASDLRTLIVHLKLTEFALVGWSMGAMAAWEYLRTYGESGVDKLTIVDMTAKIVTDDEWMHGLAGGYPADRVGHTAHSIKNDWERIAKLTASKLFAHTAVSNPALVQRFATIMRSNNPEGLANLWIDMAGQDYRSLLPRLNVDCQFIYGSESRLYKPETIAHVAQLAGVTKTFGISEAGHLPHWEQPEAFAAALLQSR
ncbi:MAG: alpha/beta hydrolase [Betaproteobacteria bacterium]|nr:alpha/beta hydrolase [Betaproteobacteria bacterium]